MEPQRLLWTKAKAFLEVPRAGVADGAVVASGPSPLTERRRLFCVRHLQKQINTNVHDFQTILVVLLRYITRNRVLSGYYICRFRFLCNVLYPCCRGWANDYDNTSPQPIL